MRSLRTQITLSIAFAVLVTVSLISFLANTMINKQFEAYVAERQKARAADIAASLQGQYNGLTGAWDTGYVHGVGMYALADGYIVKVADQNGKTVWDAENHDMTLCRQIMADITRRMEKERPEVEGDFASHQYDLIEKGQKVGSVSIRYYDPYFLSENEFFFLDSLNVLLAAIGTFSLLFALASGWFLARRIARPIIKTADIAKQIAGGDYAIQFEGKTKTRELDNLVSSINHLAESLEKQESLRKQLTADVAHELRTPLASIGSHLEAMLEKVWEPTPQRLKSCYEEILRLGKIVADLERLQRAESGDPDIQKTETDLLRLARSVCASFESRLAGKNLKFEIKGEPSFIYIDKDRIGGVISNLMSNAIKYTPEGGRIEISVKDLADASLLTVEDDGIGIPEEELPFIFERFYRADKSRNRDTGGAGIGLAVVKSVINAHGGSITAESRPGQGSRFRITLPKSR